MSGVFVLGFGLEGEFVENGHGLCCYLLKLPLSFSCNNNKISVWFGVM